MSKLVELGKVHAETKELVNFTGTPDNIANCFKTGEPGC